MLSHKDQIQKKKISFQLIVELFSRSGGNSSILDLGKITIKDCLYKRQVSSNKNLLIKVGIAQIVQAKSQIILQKTGGNFYEKPPFQMQKDEIINEYMIKLIMNPIFSLQTNIPFCLQSNATEKLSLPFYLMNQPPLLDDAICLNNSHLFDMIT